MEQVRALSGEDVGPNHAHASDALTEKETRVARVDPPQRVVRHRREHRDLVAPGCEGLRQRGQADLRCTDFRGIIDRKSTRLNSSHSQISYAVFCLKKKKY